MRESSKNLDKNGSPIKFSRDLESDWTVKNEKPHYRLKEHALVEVNNGFILATTITPASVHDTNYIPYLAIASCHTKEPIKKIYADKAYFGEQNRVFLNLNDIEDGIMRKNTTTVKLTKVEKKRYIMEQYFGLSHFHDGLRLVEVRSYASESAYRARFTTIIKNNWDVYDS